MSPLLPSLEGSCLPAHPSAGEDELSTAGSTGVSGSGRGMRRRNCQREEIVSDVMQLGKEVCSRAGQICKGDWQKIE